MDVQQPCGSSCGNRFESDKPFSWISYWIVPNPYLIFNNSIIRNSDRIMFHYSDFIILMMILIHILYFIFHSSYSIIHAVLQFSRVIQCSCPVSCGRVSFSYSHWWLFLTASWYTYQEYLKLIPSEVLFRWVFFYMVILYFFIFDVDHDKVKYESGFGFSLHIPFYQRLIFNRDHG